MKLNAKVIEELIHALHASNKRELCGFLLGSPKSKQSFIRVSNFGPGPKSFFVPEAEFLRVSKFAETQNMKVIAFIHSHIHSIELSETDLIGMKRTAFPWIIVKLAGSSIVYSVYSSED